MVDLSPKDAASTVTDLAQEKPLCDGQAILPRVGRLPIDEARRNFTHGGWTPVAVSPADRTPKRRQELAAQGLPERQECSGTDFGFCRFCDDHPLGGLSVVTAGVGAESGGLPVVVRFSAYCSEAPG